MMIQVKFPFSRMVSSSSAYYDSMAGCNGQVHAHNISMKSYFENPVVRIVVFSNLIRLNIRSDDLLKHFSLVLDSEFHT